MTDSQATLMPVLDNRVGRGLEHISFATDIIDGEEQPVVAYYGQVFPIRPGTEDLPSDELLEGQWYRLAYWRIGDEGLNYRRLFDIDTLAVTHVRDPAIFEATHHELIQLHTEGLIDGFRIDHIDGLANPRQYLVDPQRTTGGCWVVAERILGYDEALPADFEYAETTGYDLLLRVASLFHVPDGVLRPIDLWKRMSGPGEGFASTVLNTKRTVVKEPLFTELNRLVNIATVICDGNIRLRGYTRRQLNHAIRELLYQFDRHCTYVELDRATPESERETAVEAVTRARECLTTDELDTFDFIVAPALGETGETDMGGAVMLPAPSKILNRLPGRVHSPPDLRAEFMVRFVQTCGPVMVKSKEDMTFYRWNQFIGVNEIGSDPNIIGINQDDFYGFCRILAAD